VSNNTHLRVGADDVTCFARLVRGGESRAMDILHTRLEELHRVGLHLLPCEETTC